MAFHLDLLSCCNTVTEAANEMLPTFPFVEIKLCFLKQSTALQSFPLTSTPVENQGTWGKERATHNMWCKRSQARVIIDSFCWKTKCETINCGWSNVVEKGGSYLWLLQLLHSYLQPVSPVGQSLSSAVYITPWKNKHPWTKYLSLLGRVQIQT